MADSFTADLHFHSTFSDGSKSPKEIVDLIDFVGAYEALRTMCKLDHNTLLGTEEFVAEVENRLEDKRVIAGAELTTQGVLPHVGDYALHLPVFFYDDDGFDLVARTESEREEFFEHIADDYIPLLNRLVSANNHRYLNELSKKADEFFFEGKGIVSSDAIRESAERKVSKMISPDSVINASNSIVVVSQTDVADVINARGVKESPESICAKYFKREGPLYVPFSNSSGAVDVREVLRQMCDISEDSPVKVKKGLAHPSTYVRAIARKIREEEGKDPASFYHTDAEFAASAAVTCLIMKLALAGSIDFIEAHYPRNALTFSAVSGEDIARREEYLLNERMFAEEQTSYWQSIASKLRLGVSGGSDSHFREGTPVIGFGLGELSFPDMFVDFIFNRPF